MMNNGQFDAEAVIRQAGQGMAPPTWQVLRPQTSYFVMGALGYLAFTVAAIAIAVYVLISGTVFGYGLNDSTPDNVLGFWFIADMVVLALFAIGGVVAAIIRVRSMGSAGDQMMVLTPEGFVQKTGTKAGSTTRVTYANVAGMTRTISNGTVYLKTQTHDGRVLKIQINKRFGKPKQLVEDIQAGYAAYMTATANVRRGY